MKTYEHTVAPGVVIKVTVPENDTTVDDLLSVQKYPSQFNGREHT